MMSREERDAVFARFIADKGLKNTRQRGLIVEPVLRAQRAPVG